MKKLVLSIAFSFAAAVSQAAWFPIPLSDSGSYDGLRQITYEGGLQSTVQDDIWFYTNVKWTFKGP
jgi:hypothetical protein